MWTKSMYLFCKYGVRNKKQIFSKNVEMFIKKAVCHPFVKAVHPNLIHFESKRYEISCHVFCEGCASKSDPFRVQKIQDFVPPVL